MWGNCAITSRTYCPAKATTRLPRAILIQRWWRFRAWRKIESAPLGQLHSHSHHLAQHLRILRVAQDPYWNWRERVGLQNDVIPAHAAPAARMPVAGFHK